MFRSTGLIDRELADAASSLLLVNEKGGKLS